MTHNDVSNGTHVEQQVIIHMAWGIPVLILGWVLVHYVRKNQRRKHLLSALEADLLAEDVSSAMEDGDLQPNGTRHCLEAAIEEVARGIKECNECGFENFSATSHCVICGEGFGRRVRSKPMEAKRFHLGQRREWNRCMDERSGQWQWTRCVPIPDASNVALPMRLSTTADRKRQDALLAHFSRAEVMEMVAWSGKPFPEKYARFVKQAARLVESSRKRYFRLTVARPFALEQSLGHIACIPSDQARYAMRLQFVNEPAQDAGALRREWFAILNESMVQPHARLFVCLGNEKQTFYINPSSHELYGDEHLEYYRTIGWFIGRALMEGAPLLFHFAKPLVKQILGLPIELSDLADYDEELHRSLVWILEQTDPDVVEALDLDFTLCEKAEDGSVVVKELVPSGAEIKVSCNNKTEYVQAHAAYVLCDRIQPQLDALREGLFTVAPMPLLCMFDPIELDYMLCGSDTIDVDDWEQNTHVTPLLLNSRAVMHFWEIVREMPLHYRRRLLHFATGSSRVPLVGFRGLTSYDGRLCPFTIGVSTKGKRRYFESHACFNRLDIPVCMRKSDMKHMLYAILDTEAYGFTTV